MPHRFRLWFNAFSHRQLNGVTDFMNEVGWSQLEHIVTRIPNRLLQSLQIPSDWFTGPTDVFHGPTHLIPFFRHCKTVVTTHDLAFFRMSEPLEQLNSDWCLSIRKRSPHQKVDLANYRARCNFFLDLKKRVPSTLARVHHIIAVSEATAHDLVELAGISKDKITVVHNGLTPGMAPVRDEAIIKRILTNLGITGRYILYLGVLDPNKDLHNLIAGFAKTAKSFRMNYSLVIAGPRNWFRPVLEEYAHCLGVSEHVHFLGYVSDKILPVLYNGATAMVSPSPMEGFGFPVIESMACGTPVIVVNSGALPEVSSDAAIKIPPGNTEALATSMEQIAGDDNLANDLVARGFENIRRFSWKQTAKKTLDVYEKVAG